MVKEVDPLIGWSVGQKGKRETSRGQAGTGTGGPGEMQKGQGQG